MSFLQVAANDEKLFPSSVVSSHIGLPHLSTIILHLLTSYGLIESLLYIKPGVEQRAVATAVQQNPCLGNTMATQSFPL